MGKATRRGRAASSQSSTASEVFHRGSGAEEEEEEGGSPPIDYYYFRRKKSRLRNIWFGACCYTTLIIFIHLQGLISVKTTYYITFFIAVSAILTYKYIEGVDPERKKLGRNGIYEP